MTFLDFLSWFNNHETHKNQDIVEIRYLCKQLEVTDSGRPKVVAYTDAETYRETDPTKNMTYVNPHTQMIIYS